MWFQYSAKLELVLDVAHRYKAYLISCMFASHHFYTCSMSATWIYFLYQLSFQGGFLPEIWIPSSWQNMNRCCYCWKWCFNWSGMGLGDRYFWKRASCDSIVQSRLNTTGLAPTAPADGCYGEIWVEERQMFWFLKKKLKTQTFIINIVNKSRFLKSRM